MGFASLSDEYSMASIILDHSHNLIPKLNPQVIQNMGIINVDGAAAAARIKQITYNEGSNFKGDLKLNEVEVMAGEVKIMALYKAAETTYNILHNPQAYP